MFNTILFSGLISSPAGAHFPIAEMAATLDQIGGLESAKIIMARRSDGVPREHRTDCLGKGWHDLEK